MSVSKSGLLILGCHGNGFYSFFCDFFLSILVLCELYFVFFCTYTHTDYSKEMDFTGFVSGLHIGNIFINDSDLMMMGDCNFVQEHFVVRYDGWTLVHLYTFHKCISVQGYTKVRCRSTLLWYLAEIVLFYKRCTQDERNMVGISREKIKMHPTVLSLYQGTHKQ